MFSSYRGGGGGHCSTVSWHFSISLFFVIDEFQRFTHNIDDEPKIRVNSTTQRTKKDSRNDELIDSSMKRHWQWSEKKSLLRNFPRCHGFCCHLKQRFFRYYHVFPSFFPKRKGSKVSVTEKPASIINNEKENRSKAFFSLTRPWQDLLQFRKQHRLQQWNTTNENNRQSKTACSLLRLLLLRISYLTTLGPKMSQRNISVKYSEENSLSGEVSKIGEYQIDSTDRQSSL